MRSPSMRKQEKRERCPGNIPRIIKPISVNIQMHSPKEDVKPIPLAEAERRARAGAASTFAMMQRHPKYFEDSPLKGLTEQQIYESALPSHLRTPAGSAIASK